jgi:DNA-directed RNA polymerase subunit F
MTNEEIIELAHKAGLHLATDVNWMPIIGLEYLERFAKLIAEKEREACAKMVEDSWMAFARRSNRLDITPFPELTYVAEAIRARGDSK